MCRKMFILVSFVGVMAFLSSGAFAETILESFEYANEAAMYANGWTIMYGSGGTPTTDVAHTGAKAVKVDGTGINGISKEFFAEDQNNVEVTIQWYYDPVADFNSRDSCVQIFEKDGGPGGYGIMLRHQSNHRFIWRVNAATYGWAGSVFQVGWNEVRVSYDENAADVYFNDVYQTTYATTGFSKICLYRSWFHDPSYDVAWDGLTIVPKPELITEPILESFEYANEAEMYANGWTITEGSGLTLTTDVAHTGAKAVKAEGSDPYTFIRKEFFTEDQNNVDVSIQWYYDPNAGFNSRDSMVQICEKDGGPGTHGIFLRHQDNHKFLWRVDASTYAWGGRYFQVGWNEVRVSYDETGSAYLYFNGRYQTTYETTGFHSVTLGRSWYFDPGYDVAWDDLKIVPKTEPILESFEYANEAEMYANGWTITDGVGLTLTTNVAHSGSKAVKADGLDMTFIKKEFFTEDHGVDFTIQWYYDPNAGFNSRDSMVNLREEDGGPGTYGVYFRHHEDHRFIWRKDDGYHFGNDYFQVGWNEVEVSYDKTGFADVYFNGQYQTTYETVGFHSVTLGRSWFFDPNYDSAWDDLTISPTPRAQTRDLYSDTWAATDAIGRELPDYDGCGPVREGKFVGIFYFLWLGQHPCLGPYDITKILAADPYNPSWGPVHVFHHWGESELGYYLSDDEYVIRKHAYMLADAGIDTLIFDVTNALTYTSNYLTLCKIFNQIRSEGGKTPQICFFAAGENVTVIQQLYDEFYSRGFYSDLWFMWDGKPLILGDLTGHSSEVQNFFTFRSSWAWDAGYHKWPWIDTYPQDYGWDVPGVPEEVPVYAASHPVNCPGGTPIGRSFHNGSQPDFDEYALTGTEEQGLCFAEQWSRALQLDPEFIFITGWNEWVAYRFESDGTILFLEEWLPPGGTYFVDLYNQEFSRDIEPMKDGYTDNYYYQMICNIRRFKGVNQPQSPSFATAITIDGDLSDWNNVTPEFRDSIYDTQYRNFWGWGNAGTYTNTTGRNDFKNLKVACDTKYVYFYAETRENITSYTDPNWMLLFIDADQNKATGWEGYDYTVNMNVIDSTTTVVKHCLGGWSWSDVGQVCYSVSGNKMEIRIPRTYIGIDSGPDVSFDFHWSDNIQHTDDIIEFSVSGDSAPNRRFDYRYDNDIYYYTFAEDGDTEGWAAYSSLNLSVSDGVLHCDITGVNPYMHDLSTSIDTTHYLYLHLKMKNTTSDTGASFYWITDSDPAWGENKSAHFSVSSNDSEFADYWVDIGSESGWSDTVTQIRIDPSAGATSGRVDIDLIELTDAIIYEGDFDRSGCVDTLDLQKITSEWLLSNPCLNADLNEDNTVDFYDFAIMAVHWLNCEN